MPNRSNGPAALSKILLHRRFNVMFHKMSLCGHFIAFYLKIFLIILKSVSYLSY